MTALTDALDLLTIPRHEWHTQHDGRGEYRTRVSTPGLLAALEAAIAGGVGIGGSASLPNQRNVLDGDALELLGEINTTARAWATSAGLGLARHSRPGETLRRWYVTFNASPASPENEREHLKIMRRWANRIKAILEQPGRADLEDKCPAPDCGASTWWHAGQEYARPLVIVKGPEGNLVDDARGICRACGHIWAARELAFELETQRRAALAKATQTDKEN